MRARAVWVTAIPALTPAVTASAITLRTASLGGTSEGYPRPA
jgi:hypothetical protein